MDIQYPSALNLAQLPTPLQQMPRISEGFGGGHRLWVKRDDLTGAALSGNKVRKLEYVVAAAIEQGCDTLITCGGVQSNHCRATALVGAQLGLDVHLLLRGEAPADVDGNLLLDHLAGARVSHYPSRQYAAELDELLQHWQQHYAEKGCKACVIPTGASDGVGIWGYIAAAEELGKDLQQAGLTKAHVVSATGSGGTQAGLTLGAAIHGLPIQVWGVNVCDDEAWFLNKVRENIADWRQRYAPEQPLPEVEVRVIDGYVGPGYGRAGPEVFETIALVARLEGLVLDPVYTGKAFHAMLQEIEAGRFDGCEDIVFLHTGGIFGVFPQRAQFFANPQQ
jgi:D-cysteine desulfhydrase